MPSIDNAPDLVTVATRNADRPSGGEDPWPQSLPALDALPEDDV